MLEGQMIPPPEPGNYGSLLNWVLVMLLSAVTGLLTLVRFFYSKEMKEHGEDIAALKADVQECRDDRHALRNDNQALSNKLAIAETKLEIMEKQLKQKADA